ncbi:LytR/AlgR family response regulator transcription factor [Pontibacter akesuensis]|uniref:Two component transcriptional regulator, LytTR family n=1 Tax=Pontibacter akesuensis TaxID=388950 RepID=A0A1I7IEY8_9BACT|nr:LytTR family DNA-binding domain-containing protein [Pontibacter akesuensis]GHA66892.1 DNA-binding response regulator [Pontibacter akesuensis]SFU71514.1 two component transcriptional regulator, LytTR family [Pontibacter akesuensis]
MKCIAIDDEPKALSVIAHYAQKVPSLQLVQTFRSSIDALEYLTSEQVDFIFLDINMPDLTGIEFLRALPQPPMVIFTTAYSEYAVESYDWDTVGYLLKPIDFQKFLKAVNKAAMALKLRGKPTTDTAASSAEFIRVKSGIQTYQLKLDDILYLEASGNYVTFVTSGKKITTLSSLTELQKQLPTSRFLRVHKSFMVSLPHVEVFESYQVRIAGTEVPVGRTFREALLEVFKQ